MLISKVIDQEDALGLKNKHLLPFIGNKGVDNTRWRFLTDPQKVRQFEVWLQTNLDSKLLDMNETGPFDVAAKYVCIRAVS